MVSFELNIRDSTIKKTNYGVLAQYNQPSVSILRFLGSTISNSFNGFFFTSISGVQLIIDNCGFKNNENIGLEVANSYTIVSITNTTIKNNGLGLLVTSNVIGTSFPSVILENVER